MPSDIESILACIEEPTLILDESGLIVRFNSTAKRLFDIEDNVIGGSAILFFEQNNMFSRGTSFDSFKDHITGKINVQAPVTFTLESTEYGAFLVKLLKVEKNIVLFFKTESTPQSGNIYWESLEKMWESQKSSLNIMESIPSAIFICKQRKGMKPHFIILDCNPAAENMVKKSLVE
nr:PAS domain-containing protein [Candidatus Sigynarchaeota archaeon]